MSRGWSADHAPPTTFVLVRHGATAHTADKRFSGGLGGANPPLSPDGQAQVRAAVAVVRGLAPDAVVTSPVGRAQESATLLADALGLAEPVVEDGLAETDFGTWEGLTFAEVRESDPEGMDAWLGSTEAAAGGSGESFVVVRDRVLAARDRLLAAYAGRVVLVVSHVTPIKLLVADALGAPLEALYRMELAAASVSVVDHHPQPSLRLFNATPVTPG